MANVTAAIVKADDQDTAEMMARTWAEGRKSLDVEIAVVHVEVKGQARMIGTDDTFWYVDIHWVVARDMRYDAELPA